MSKSDNNLVMSQNNEATYAKTLIDRPINLSRKRIIRNNKLALAALPKPLEPTPYIAQRPVPRPRKKAPVSLPRITRPRPRPVNRKVNKLISEITPYYSPEKIEKVKKELKFIKRAEITKVKKALKSEFTRGPGRGDTCHLSVFDETLPGSRYYPITLKDKVGRLRDFSLRS